jgi:hypothetical protein
MMESEEAGQGTYNYVRQCPSGTMLANWKIVEILEVTFISK